MTQNADGSWDVYCASQVLKGEAGTGARLCLAKLNSHNNQRRLNVIKKHSTSERPAGTSRRQVIQGGMAIGAALLGSGAALADSDAKADFLFVQTASSMAYAADRNLLTLHGVSPVTVFFSDRPERIAGNMHTADFVPFWSEGPDSFHSDPPNADLSILENGKLRQVVLVLENPQLNGTDLHYTVKQILEGEMPVLGSDVSVFIDVIGMPLSPVSFAGVDRRAYRRAAIMR